MLNSAVPSETAVVSDSFAPEGANVNIKFDNIVNMRDLCTASATVAVVPAKIFRTGCVSKASDADVSTTGINFQRTDDHLDNFYGVFSVD